jgi:tetratricopeptide (TPR) repeat protein
MTPRRPSGAGAAALCLSALAAGCASFTGDAGRSQGAASAATVRSAPPAAAVRGTIPAPAARGAAPPAAHPGATADSIAGPLRLVRPLAPETIARTMQEAEAMYRQRRADEALKAYATVVAVDPMNAHAWLRLGNLNQQAGRETEALEAYLQASLTVPRSEQAEVARGKSLLNIALLGLAQARRAIDELDAMDLPELEEQLEDVARQAWAQRLRARRAAEPFATSEPAREPVAVPADTTVAPVTPRVPGTSGTSGTSAARPAVNAAAPADRGARAAAVATGVHTDRLRADREPRADPVEPYTVDRWIARPRRPIAARPPGRASLAEPVTEAPLPPAPRVETIRGGTAVRR